MSVCVRACAEEFRANGGVPDRFRISEGRKFLEERRNFLCANRPVRITTG